VATDPGIDCASMGEEESTKQITAKQNNVERAVMGCGNTSLKYVSERG
jgi:hypothetical protein